VGVVLIAGAFWFNGPFNQPVKPGSGGGVVASAAAAKQAPSPSLVQVNKIIEHRCTACHAEKPSQPGFSAPPAGIALDSKKQVIAHAAQIKQVVKSGYMPLGNITGMTKKERAAIAAWHKQAASRSK
jgi:uncharacterized membrane protein